MRVNEGKITAVMICISRQIFRVLLFLQSIVFYFSLIYRLKVHRNYQIFPIISLVWFAVCWIKKRHLTSESRSLLGWWSLKIALKPRDTAPIIIYSDILLSHCPSLCRHGVFPFNLVFVSMDTCIIYKTSPATRS